MHVLSLYGAPISVENNKLYSKLAAAIINSDSASEQCLTELRDVVHKIVAGLRSRGGNGAGARDKTLAAFSYLFHFCVRCWGTKWKFLCGGMGEDGVGRAPDGSAGSMCRYTLCPGRWKRDLHMCLGLAGKGEQMTVVSTKAATSLVRYCDVVAADRVFSDAGMANRAIKNDNAAFVFLNRFLDIADAMEETDSSMALDNSEFEGTDIPFDFALPAKPCLSEAKKDAIKVCSCPSQGNSLTLGQDWVLTMSMDQKVDPQLPTRPCDKCSKPMYEAALKCSHCKVDYTPCIVTGPLPHPSVLLAFSFRGFVFQAPPLHLN